MLLEQHDRTLSMGRSRLHLAEIVSSLYMVFFFIASEYTVRHGVGVAKKIHHYEIVF